ncbi:hypothetical protein LTR22_007288 [Elasticomyces elasticus]|nr:hypothetical protein LTR22_007288 [Elasticomyces elasticus]KAK4925573.1 hypothetical protein LTR49_007411 [Elasticomyces elasticus]KAK5759851.1 hypothetical protein LTS12_010038 [Elasticomyces elasticus]
MRRVDILPDGDIILAVKGSLELRVSSVVLSMVSPVFKTMLGPHFAEGQALRRQSAGLPHVITLPDDDAQLMKVLCLVSHHQARGVQAPSDEASKAMFVIELVALADKYDCMEILKYPAASCMTAVDPELLNRTTRMMCAEAAFKLDDALFFGRYAVRETADRTLSILAGTIDDIVTSAGDRLGALYEHHSVDNCFVSKECEYNTAAVGTVLRALRAVQLRPPSSQSCKLRDKIRSVQALEVPTVTLISPCETCFDGDSENILEMFERTISHARNTVQRIFTAVCSDCLKQISEKNSTCRTPHHGEWATSDEDGDGRLHYYPKLGDW